MSTVPVLDDALAYDQVEALLKEAGREELVLLAPEQFVRALAGTGLVLAERAPVEVVQEYKGCALVAAAKVQDPLHADTFFEVRAVLYVHSVIGSRGRMALYLETVVYDPVPPPARPLGRRLAHANLALVQEPHATVRHFADEEALRKDLLSGLLSLEAAVPDDRYEARCRELVMQFDGVLTP